MIGALLRRRRRFLVFCLVGGSGVLINMAVYLVALAGLDRLGARGLLAVNLAALVGWAVSVASNFALNDRFTFRAGPGQYAASGRRRLARYYGSASVAFALQAGVLNGALLALGAGLDGWLRAAVAPLGPVAPAVLLLLTYQRTIANLIGIGVATVANYLLARHWVFRRVAEEPARAAD